MTLPELGYNYRAQLIRVVDGDTVVLALDLGVFISIVKTIRLIGIDTPEVVGATAEAGKAASQYAKNWFGGAIGGPWALIVHTELDKGDKYGRLLGRVYRTIDGECLNEALLQSGHAVSYGGGTRG